MNPASRIGGRRTAAHARLLCLSLILISVALPGVSQNRGLCAEQVRLRTSDGVLLEGITYGASGQSRKTALLLVHGFGGEFYTAYFPALAQAAAREGYTTLALNMRDHGAGPKISDFAASRLDIAAGAEYLRQRGFAKLALLGHSMGTNQVLLYQAASADRSVAATILVGGPGDPFEWNVWQAGKEKAQAVVDQALQLRQAGQEGQLMLVDMGPLGKLLYSPRYLLSIRGPERQSNPYQNLRKIGNPVLMLYGKQDKLVPPDVPERLRSARPGQKTDLIFIDGAAHQFHGYERQLTDAALSWLNRVAP